MLLKIQNVGKKQKTKKKNLRPPPDPCTITPFPRPLCPCPPGLWISLCSEPREGEEARGQGGPGDLPLGPHLLSQCRAGWGVRFIYVPLAHSSTYASPPPRPLHVLCLAHSPQLPGLLQSPPTRRGEMGWMGHLAWDQQGVPVTGPSPLPNRSHLVHPIRVS